MARGPPGPGGLSGTVQPLTWLPGMAGGRNLTEGANDQIVIQFQPNPQTAADIARRQELRTRATEYVTRVHPDVPTAARRMLIGLTEINMEWGMHREDAGGRAIPPGSPVGTPTVSPDDPFSGRPPAQAAGPRIPPGTSPTRRRTGQTEPQEAPPQPPPPPPAPPIPPPNVEDPTTGFRPRGIQGPPMSGPRR